MPEQCTASDFTITERIERGDIGRSHRSGAAGGCRNQVERASARRIFRQRQAAGDRQESWYGCVFRFGDAL